MRIRRHAIPLRSPREGWLIRTGIPSALAVTVIISGLILAAPVSAHAHPAAVTSAAARSDPGPPPVQECSGWVQISGYALELKACVQDYLDESYVDHFAYLKYLGAGTSRAVNFAVNWETLYQSGLCQIKSNLRLKTGQEATVSCDTPGIFGLREWTRAQVWDAATRLSLGVATSPQLIVGIH